MDNIILFVFAALGACCVVVVIYWLATYKEPEIDYGPHMLGPDGERYRIAEEKRLSGDTWFRVDRWGWGSDMRWGPYLKKHFETLSDAQAGLEALFDQERKYINASRAPVFPPSVVTQPQ